MRVHETRLPYEHIVAFLESVPKKNYCWSRGKATQFVVPSHAFIVWVPLKVPPIRDVLVFADGVAFLCKSGQHGNGVDTYSSRRGLLSCATVLYTLHCCKVLPPFIHSSGTVTTPRVPNPPCYCAVRLLLANVGAVV